MKKLVVLTGAGISAESGLKTFRDSDGLWQGHDIKEVATPQGWRKNHELVLEFYNQRRRQLHKVQPNRGHKTLFELENNFDVHIITQNVDNLHEKAGSSNIIHLHGELFKVRSVKDKITFYIGKLIYIKPILIKMDFSCDPTLYGLEKMFLHYKKLKKLFKKQTILW
jgi:NAD-dependent SIR2 family protein deacetylase